MQLLCLLAHHSELPERLKSSHPGYHGLLFPTPTVAQVEMFCL